MITYIVKTKSSEYYCGATIHLCKRLLEHRIEKHPHWFSFKNRKNFILVYKIEGDYEKKIKKFGIKNFIKCLNPR